MSLKIKVSIVLMTVALLLAGALAGCGTDGKETLPEPAYAGAITDGILTALNSGDYAAFSKDFDEAMKKAIPETDFQEMAAAFDEKIGDYVSKKYVSRQDEVQKIYTVVIYQAEFTREPAGVKVTITFLETVGGEVLVSGLFFNSPKLR